MYLYVDKEKGVTGLPEALLTSLGRLQSVMTLDLSHERRLARVDVLKVMKAVEEQGFYLQMPPQEMRQEP